MDNTGGRGDEEAVEIFPELFDFVTPWNAVYFQKRRGCFRIIRFQFQPNVGLAQIRYLVDPEAVRAKLENATIGFFLDQRQRERIAIKGNRLVVGVARAFERDVRAA